MSIQIHLLIDATHVFMYVYMICPYYVYILLYVKPNGFYIFLKPESTLPTPNGFPRCFPWASQSETSHGFGGL